MQYFYVSNVVTAVGLWLAYLWAGWEGFGIAVLLTIMEVTLSFDNAVVNAVVLKDMSKKWQDRFLTWGILIAVFGMRLLFPLAIVAFATGLSIVDVGHLALNQPDEYSRHVLNSHIDIAAFGGMFLLMVFLHYFFDHEKDIHWLAPIEKHLVKIGKLESVEVILALTLMLTLQYMLPEEHRAHALTSGVIGVVLYVAITSMTSLMSGSHAAGHDAAKATAYSGFMGFMYLQVLDASFSLDGVIGAFAMSKDVVIIMLGLGIGAMFVRSMTIYIVRKGTLNEYIYLEHGAHYGIGALAIIMLFSMYVHVSEVITGLIGVTFIGLSLLSSVRHKRKIAAA
jgi:uncharacterized protein